jgi:hypothetical protein
MQLSMISLAISLTLQMSTLQIIASSSLKIVLVFQDYFLECLVAYRGIIGYMWKILLKREVILHGFAG